MSFTHIDSDLRIESKVTAPKRITAKQASATDDQDYRYFINRQGLIHWAFFLLLAFTLLGCASDQQALRQIDQREIFNDALFAADVYVPAPEAIFALREQDKIELKRAFARSQSKRQNLISPHVWLGQYINAHKGGFTYQDNITRVADDTMTDRQGNCMSLVVLSASLAEVLNIPVQIQDIEVEPIWDRRGGFYLVNGHVNLKLLAPTDNQSIIVTKSEILVDFLPERAIRGYRATDINKQRLVAMFYNNVAAEAMVQGDYDTAYAYAKQSLETDPYFVSGVNTLAVIYRHKGQDKLAEKVYRHGIALDENNLITLYNLSLILGEQDRLDEWAQIHKKLELARIANPFYYFDMAQQAYFDKEYQHALTWYKRAVEKADYRHEFYFGLSRAYWATGDQRRAKKHMEKAIQLSSADNKHRYQLKLQAMQGH
jgi:Tfp pilus assembly protein PilF